MFKKVMSIICALFIFGGGICMTSFDTKAVEHYEMYINAAEPAKSDNQGYIVLILKNSISGEYIPTTLFWSTYGVANGNESVSYGDVHLSNSGVNGTIEFTVSGHSGTTSGLYTLYEIETFGRFVLKKHSSSERYSYTWAGYNIVSWVTAGNSYVYGVETDVNKIFSVYFNTDNVSMLLMELISTLSLSLSYDQSILSTVNSILGSVDGVENQLSSVIEYLRSVDSELDSIRSELQLIYQKADALLLEQKVSNTWLEKIYNFFAEKDEKDKEAATQQGNQSSKDVSDMIQDDSAGFVDSLGGLTSSMSYTGTNCSWTFPTVKLPAIPGVMDEVTLVESKEIDFTYWVNSIPSGILLLIQSVCTVALIIFCFKELYGAISYVLTLKGGGSE